MCVRLMQICSYVARSIVLWYVTFSYRPIYVVGYTLLRHSWLVNSSRGRTDGQDVHGDLRDKDIVKLTISYAWTMSIFIYDRRLFSLFV